MGQNTSTVLPRQARRELKRKKCQILLTFNQGHYCHKGSTSLNVSDTAIVQALQLDIHTAKWSWKICYGKKNWALNLELILASTPDKTNYKLLHLKCLFLWPDSEKHPFINNSILHSQVSKYTFYNIISFKQNSNVNLYFVPATSFFLLNRKPYGITFWYGSSRHIFRFFFASCQKMAGTSILPLFFGGWSDAKSHSKWPSLSKLKSQCWRLCSCSSSSSQRVSTLKQDV